MTTYATKSAPKEKRLARPLRLLGYGISIAINLVLVWVVSNLLAWDILPFLTDDFESIQPLILFSLWVSIALTVGYCFYDPAWFKLAGDTLGAGIAFVVIYNTYQVFPFEFSSGFWTGATRTVLILIGIATAIATLANVVRIFTGRVWEDTDTV